MVDSRAGSNLLYLPLDKLLQQAGATAGRGRPAQPARLRPSPPPTLRGSTFARATARAAATAKVR
jgi:membrane protease subunit HflK